MALKYEDANMIKYFWEGKGDLTRYSGYENIFTQLKEECPLLFDGLSMIKRGEDLVAVMLNKIVEESLLDEDIIDTVWS